MQLQKFLIPLVMSFGVLSADISLPYAEIGLGYDYFRSLPEGDWDGNTGGLISFNVAAPAPCLEEQNIDMQLGGSYGIYDWSGRGSAPSGLLGQSQQQAFLTAAIAQKDICFSGISAGLAFDWMWNRRASVFAANYNISQLRFRAGYLSDCENEWGVWGTLNTQTAHKSSQGIPVSFRAISQVNLYWEHYYENCARTMVWIGLPYKKSLSFSSGRAGKFIVGADFQVPLTCSFSIEGHASYMHGHSAPTPFKSRYYAANIYLGLKWAFGDSECCTFPYFSVGNNSNFITDTSLTF